MGDAEREELRRLAERVAHERNPLSVIDRFNSGQAILSLLASLSQAEAERDAARKAMQAWADGSAALMDIEEHADALAAEVVRLRELLQRMLKHSCIADIGDEDKDIEDQDTERDVRAALKGAGA